MTTTNPRDFVKLLEVFKIGLLNGLIEKEAITKWADEIILADDEPDYLIIEISLAKTPNDTIALIDAFVGQNISSDASRIILGILYRQLQESHLNLRRSIAVMYTLTRENLLTKQEASAVFYFDMEYDMLCCGGYVNRETLYKEALQFLEVYKDFTIENYALLPLLNHEIEFKFKQCESAEYYESKPWWKFWKN
jgi:hypothetical protein